MSANERILLRLSGAMSAYREGRLSLRELQDAVLLHGRAVEGGGTAWDRLILEVEGRLEIVGFTQEAANQARAVQPHLDRLEQAIKVASQRDG